ncbi:MAG: hypothetical protein WC634_02245 [archaeon]
MTVVANFFGKIIKAIPALVAKVGTVLLLIFTIGMVAGYALALGAITPAIFLIPIVAMAVMWYRLDEGVLILILLTAIILLFPEIFNSFFSSFL